MSREELIQRLRRLLNTDSDIQYLLKLHEEEIDSLTAAVSDRIRQVMKSNEFWKEFKHE